MCITITHILTAFTAQSQCQCVFTQGSHISDDTPFGDGVPATPSSPKLSPSARVKSVQRTGDLMSFEQAYSARGSK